MLLPCAALLLLWELDPPDRSCFPGRDCDTTFTAWVIRPTVAARALATGPTLPRRLQDCRPVKIALFLVRLSPSPPSSARALPWPRRRLRGADYPPITDATLSGSYLAARIATAERDTDAAVAYLRALLKMDPRNEEILERTFFAMLVDGDLDSAVPLAEKLVKLDRTNRIARLVLAARAIKKNEYQRARTNLSLSVRGPIGDLTATLLAAWTMLGSGNAKAGVR